MIRLLLDQNMPRSAVRSIRVMGWDCAHVFDHGLATAPDEEILDWAAMGGWIIVTGDTDFPALLALGGHHTPSVIFIRMRGMNRHTLPELLRALIPPIATSLEQGAIVSVEAAGARVRVLPITRP